MHFGTAVEALKGGKKVAREGWNGKGMWLVLVSGSNYSVDAVRSGSHSVLPFIGMKTSGDEFVPWLASQTDVLAEDWMLVGETNQYGDYLTIDGTLEEIGDTVINETAEIVELELRNGMMQAGENHEQFIFERVVNQIWTDEEGWHSEQLPGCRPIVTVGVKATRIKE